MANTQQRDVILSVLKEAARPLTREEILSLGRQQIPRLGSATVNRAIREMTVAEPSRGICWRPSDRISSRVNGRAASFKTDRITSRCCVFAI